MLQLKKEITTGAPGFRIGPPCGMIKYCNLSKYFCIHENLKICKAHLMKSDLANRIELQSNTPEEVCSRISIEATKNTLSNSSIY